MNALKYSLSAFFFKLFGFAVQAKPVVSILEAGLWQLLVQESIIEAKF